MSRFPPPLRFTLPGLLLVVGLLAESLLLFIELSSDRRRVIESATADTRVLGMIVVAELTTALRNENAEQAQDQITHLIAHPEIRAANLVDAQGSIRFSSDVQAADPGLDVLPAPVRQRVATLLGKGTPADVAAVGETLIGTFPVELPGEQDFGARARGLLVLERDLRSRLAAARGLAVRRAALQGVVILAVVALLYFALGRLMLRRLDAVRGAARRIAEGDHDARAGVHGSDEIATLGADVDWMAARLAERAALEHALHQSQKLESLGQLTGGVAHDFNNLLAAISMTAGVLRDAVPRDHPKRGLIGEIQDICQRGGALTRRLLQFARKDTSAKQPFDLAATLTELTSLLDRLLPDDITLRVHSQLDEASVNGSRSSVEQCIVNLVVNARDAMPHGGRIDVELHRAARAGRPFAAVEVRDTGEGIPEALHERVFEPFFTTKETGKGTGLGLASAYGIAKQHGGDITLGSAVGRGSVFTLWLPLHAHWSLPPPSPVATETPVSPRPGGTILLVEDNPAVRNALSRMIGEHGLTVRSVASAGEAIDALVESPSAYDLIISDLGLPGMSGLELRRRLLDRVGDVPILLISGHADHRGARAEIERENIPLLEKPFSPAELLERILALIASRRDGDRAEMPSDKR